MFKINTDKFGFAREPQPDRVSRDYAAELVRKLIADEKAAREANDNILDGYISQEADIRGTEDARIQALIGEINTVLNSHGGSISGLLEQVQAEVQARKSEDNALQALINALQAASAKEIEDRTSKDTELDTRITAEASAREAKDAELQDKITAEASTREAKDAELQSAIEAEATARKDKDREFQSAIISETSARAAADTTLDGKIAAEASAREAADSELQTNIDQKQDKVKVLRIASSEGSSYVTGVSFNLSSGHNREYRVDYLVNALEITIPNSVYPNDYITSLSFGTGDTAPQVSYSATGIINWVGTDCSVSNGKSIFAPKANTRYEIVIYYNGVQFIGLVNGFIPATVNNSGQTEATS